MRTMVVEAATKVKRVLVANACAGKLMLPHLPLMTAPVMIIKAAVCVTDLVHVSAAEDTKRALVQVHDGKILPAHGVHGFIALNANEEERAQLLCFFEHGDVALVKHIPRTVHVDDNIFFRRCPVAAELSDAMTGGQKV